MYQVFLVVVLILVSSTAFAKEYYVAKIPVSVDTSEKKMAYAYRGMEQLRLLHNQKGQDYLDGKLTKIEWDTWVKDVFRLKQNALLEVIHNQKVLMKKSTTYTVDLEVDLEKKIAITN